MRAGIFLDVENLVRCGGWGIRFRAVRQLVEAQGATVVRANAYMAVDRERENEDPEYRVKKAEYRDAVRREGFHLGLKEVHRHYDEEGRCQTRADVDLDLAVDAMLQAENLDYVLIGSGDGNFVRLVQALQSKGRRVDLLSFSNTSRRLRSEVDNHFSGFLYPGILPETREEIDRVRGVMHHVIEDKGFGFLTVQTGMGVAECRDDVFLHINDFADEDGLALSNEQFAAMKRRHTIIEFDLVEQEQGKFKAVDACEFVPPAW